MTLLSSRVPHHPRSCRGTHCSRTGIVALTAAANESRRSLIKSVVVTQGVYGPRGKVYEGYLISAIHTSVLSSLPSFLSDWFCSAVHIQNYSSMGVFYRLPDCLSPPPPFAREPKKIPLYTIIPCFAWTPARDGHISIDDHTMALT